ncbi:MAG: ImmA/IrrE family metallo-endopeptidase [Gemmatimonadales bacterium]
MPKVAVPITPAVLEWAISESGSSAAQIAAEAGVQPAELDDWLEARSQPGISEARALARVLRRPIAALLLPEPPSSRQASVAFRHLPGVPGRSLTPTERRYVRKALRLQNMLSSVAKELGEPPPALPRFDVGTDSLRVAAAVGGLLQVMPQPSWSSASVAFDAWREAIERQGVAVFLFQLGPDNCRGFSLWNGRVPVIAVNTAWNDEARTFTLLHELGHLVAGTDSACGVGDPAALTDTWDPVERWCESFAAAVLLPEAALREAIADRLGGTQQVTDVAQVATLARRFRASLRATAIRLIELGVASWDLYRSLPPLIDAKRGGGGGKGGRDRQEIQEDSLGNRTTDMLRRAVSAAVVTRTEALTYLDMPDHALDSPARSG